MYTHARQFPHLAGMSDTEIRQLAGRALGRRPNLIRIKRIRDAVVIGAMTLGAIEMKKSGMGLGPALMIAGGIGGIGGIATLVLVAWNVVWLNTVLFRLTKDERQRSPA